MTYDMYSLRGAREAAMILQRCARAVAVQVAERRGLPMNPSKCVWLAPG